jgi:transcriptional regulator with XRE-family HTH domain
VPDRYLAEFLGSIAANVRRARLRRGLTQETLAERAGQDLSYLQRVERGATNLSVGVLLALARALGVPPAALVRKARLAPVTRGRPPKRKKAGAEKSGNRHGR